MGKSPASYLIKSSILLCFLLPFPGKAEIVSDHTLPEKTVVTPKGDVIQIDGGTTRGSNLFHSFQEFSVPVDTQANFNNTNTIDNILSRVTGGRESIIEGGISSNGTANLFLINPAGIIFGENSFLNVGGSFVATTADSLLFPDGIEYSATDLQSPPILTINAPIGLGFRENPGDILIGDIENSGNSLENLIGLRVPQDRTLALIGGNILINRGILSTIGGRIEVGSVAENNTVSLIPIKKGFDFDYDQVTNFQDISLSFAAKVSNFGANTGNIEVQGRNISLIEGSQIGIVAQSEGQAGDINIIASESLTLNGNSSKVNRGQLQTLISSNIFDNARGKGSTINIKTPQLTITNGAQIASINFNIGKGADINIHTTEEIKLEKPFFIDNPDTPFFLSGIFANVKNQATGNGGSIVISTKKLTLNQGAEIATDTFGAGNAGDLIINAAESIELIGTVPNRKDPDPSGLFANVGNAVTAKGNGGDLTVNTPKLVVRDGAKIGTVARNKGDGGKLTLYISDSILLTGTSYLAQFPEGRSGIFVSAQPSFRDQKSGEIIPTTGNTGIVNLYTKELTIEKGANISINTFSEGNGGTGNINVNKLIVRDGGQIGAGSLLEANNIDTKRGNGGTLNINATESVEINGVGDINGEPVNSSLFTLAESTGDAGNLTLTSDNLTVSEGGEINVSASASGAAGNLTITANSLDLNSGTLTAATAAGTEGNIKLEIDDNITLSNNSLISAAATGSGSAGNLTINANSLDLNQGTLTAETAAGKGGNIKLEIDDNITLNNNSLISAAATGTANGGNIDIDTTFIIASPMGNSDIIASAGKDGTGGKITIDAQGIFGIRERTRSSRTNDTNDLDASGGVDGEVIINTPDVDLTSGLVKLPQNVVEPEQTVVQACQSDRISGKTSSFKIKGQGGLAASPNQLPDSDSTPAGWVSPAPIKEKEAEVEIDAKNPKEVTETVSLDDIIPAQGVIVDQQGKIILVGYVPTANETQRSRQNLFNCLKQRHEIDK